MKATREKIRADYETVLERIRKVHIKTFSGCGEPVFFISDAYPGVWLEHVYDALVWAELEPQMAHVARGQVKLFLDRQREDGQLPCYVLDASNPNARGYGSATGYGQIQECVSFTRLCWEASRILGDGELLEEAYEKCVRWDRWLCANRMTLGTGLIELFCVFDTGHDNSARFAGIPGPCPQGDAKRCSEAPGLPLLAPDMNAVFYGSRAALSEMAAALGKREEARRWKEKAEQVRAALWERCYCPEDEFFYDADCNGRMRRFRSIHISNLFQEHIFSQEEADRIYARHLRNPEEFWTPYPFPSMAMNDPGSVRDRAGNSWGFYSQGLTALRALRWMDFYGKGEDLEELMYRWVEALVCSEEMRFGQELHPVTGEPSESSQWYSSTMLFYISACRRLGLDRE